jgi:tRNA pseudouridine32 synthase / 23S rRNA pseudouridine746 synthase
MKLPTKNGVGASVIVLPEGAWSTVLEFLVERFPHIAADEIVARMARGDVLDARGAHVAPAHAYTPREKLYYYRDIPNEPAIPFVEEILFQDDYLVAVDKPHFMPVTPVGCYVQQSLLVRLKRKLGIENLAPMHRIDRDTAGVVLFTIQPDTRGAYQSLFESRDVEKQYQAIAPFDRELQFPLTYRSRLETAEHFMQMREVAGVPNAETSIDVMESGGSFARYRLRPRTGKKHQLRVHMAALGLPIVNDRIYPGLAEIDEDDFSAPLQLLAEQIRFIDPITERERQFVSRRKLAPLEAQRGRTPLLFSDLAVKTQTPST